MSWRRRGVLVLLCMLPNLFEAAVAALAHLRSGLGLAVQANAPAPFGLFGDLRWLAVYHDGWLGFGLESAGVLAARGALTAVTVRAAWPSAVPPPPFRGLLMRGVLFTAGAAVLLVPWVILLFGMAVVSVSWFFLAAVPSALVVALLSHHGAVRGGWWRQVPSPRALGWMVLTFLTSSVAAGIANVVPWLAAVAVVVAAGVFDAFAWWQVVAAIAIRVPSRHVLPVSPAGLASLLAAAISGTAVGFTTAAAPAAAASAGAGQSEGGRGEPVVLIAAGFGTSYGGGAVHPIPGSAFEQRFSYRGTGPTGAPLPYGAADTNQPLDVLVALMSDQVDRLAQRAGRRIDLVAESEGSLVAEAYAATHPDAPLSSLVLVSPLVTPASVYFPPPGRSGWGVAAGAGLVGLGDLVDSMAPEDLSAMSPFVRSVEQAGPALRQLLSCPDAGVRRFALLPLADAVAALDPQPLGVPWAVVPAFHGGLLGDPEVDRDVIDVFDGHEPDQGAGWALLEDVLRSSATAWQVPDLEPTLNSSWNLPSAGATSAGACATARRALAA